MPKTLATAFNRLAASLTTSSSESSSNRRRRDAISKKLNERFDVLQTTAIGSFQNGTDIPSFSDADYLVWLTLDSIPARSDSLLTSVRTELQNRYPTTTIQTRTPAVKLSFGSGRETIEVVPARFGRSLANNTIVFEIADTGGNWKETCPSLHNHYVQVENGRLDSKLKPLIRIVKAWNAWNNIGLSSFYLEMRCTKRMEQEPSIYHSIDFLSILRYLKRCELARMQDPTTLSGYIAPCSPSYVNSALGKLTRAIASVEEAMELEKNDMPYSAFAIMKEVFNGRFPARS